MFYKKKPVKPKIRVDEIRREYAVTLESGVPLRIHNENGGYLFSLFFHSELGVYRFKDKRWGDRRKINAKKISWEQPI